MGTLTHLFPAQEPQAQHPASGQRATSSLPVHLPAAQGIADLVSQLDTLMLGRAFGELAAGLARHPADLARVAARGARGLLGIAPDSLLHALGGDLPPPQLPPEDARFRDPGWERLPSLALLRAYLLWRSTLLDLVEAAQLEDRAADKARFGLQLLLDAVSPSNFPWSNPQVLRRGLETRGRSVARGLRNFVDDVTRNRGRPRPVDSSPFEVGVNLAATPGKVVYRNRLVELIQYAPRTQLVHEVPLLCSPPWINKYYVMDLSPGRSFIEWAVEAGHTVFALSYRNPDEAMRDVRLDDYLISGPRSALSVIQDITGAPTVNVIGLCLGGALTGMLVAFLEATGEPVVNTVTLLNTLLDYTEPGPVGMFTAPETVRAIEGRMRRRGYLAPSEMQAAFDLLRANDQIWKAVVNNWLLGEDPPAHDILAWSYDTTRMPAAMHAFYLNACYLRNELARGEMELAGERLDLGRIRQDLFVVGAEKDHVVPWRSAYRTTQLVGGNATFVLSNGGHVAGIVNPPNSRCRARISDRCPPDPDQWLETAESRPDSWWQLWAEWVGPRSGRRRPPPAMGSARYPALLDAPGSYVHQR